MKVMLVNDDGYGAPGIEAMAEALKNAGHEVLVAAPDGQRSGSGQSVTLDGEVRAVRKPLGWALTGTPADCVRAGLLHLMPDCDMVISGINLGANLGTDCNYSGTAAAAREAVMNGRAAMAVSCAIRPGLTSHHFIPQILGCFTSRPVSSFTSLITESTNDSPVSICPPGKVIPPQFLFSFSCTTTFPLLSYIIHIFVSSIFSYLCIVRILFYFIVH